MTILNRLKSVLRPAPAPKKAKKPEKKKRPSLRMELREVVDKLAGAGFRPGTVIDVGFNTGTPGLYDHFSDAKYLMVDPLAESEFFMKHQCSKLKDAAYVVSAAGAQEGELEIKVTPDYGGSSAYLKGGNDVRKVPMTTLDIVAKRFGAAGPYLIKVDVQGAELEVLKGATEVLKNTEAIIAEARIFPFHGAPEIGEVLKFLDTHGFVLYDIFNPTLRPSDGALGQVDIVAVKRDGFFRTATAYRTSATYRTAEQKQANIEGKLRKREALLKQIQSELDHPPGL